jgi:glycosyltransferase involved in cell wall biosynthesis
MQPITIIIPTYNRANALKVVWQSYIGNPLVKRIIIVNDGSTDNTKTVLEHLIEHSPTPVTVIHHSKKQGQQISRMDGIAIADTKWILFGEDDVYLGQNYINTLLAKAEELGAKIIAGRILAVAVNDNYDPSKLCDDESPYMDNIFDIKHFAARFDARSKVALPAPFLHTIALINRSVFVMVGFDKRYRGTAHREETDFYLTANAAGFPIFWTPATACYHLRGTISLTGGQRGRKLNLIKIEFWGYVNTWMLVKKHWHLLSKKYDFERSPLWWFVIVYCRDRFLLYADRMFSGRISKTWSNK